MEYSLGRVKGSTIRTGENIPTEFTGWLENDIFILKTMGKITFFQYKLEKLEEIQELTELKRIRDLGTFELGFSPSNETSELNKVTEVGLYIFSYKTASIQPICFMIVEDRDFGTKRQTIFEGYNTNNNVYHFTIRTSALGSWTTSTFSLPNTKYLSNTYYNKEEMQEILKTLSTLNFQVVKNLPTEDIDDKVIYLVPENLQEDGEPTAPYEEWIYINNTWELIGTTKVDLDEYVKTQDIQDGTIIAGKTKSVSIASTQGGGSDEVTTFKIPFVNANNEFTQGVSAFESFGSGIIVTRGNNGQPIVQVTVLKAQQDADGNNIVDTYAKKTEIGSGSGGALIDLGKIDEDPNDANNSVLNNIKQTGLYTFTYTYKNILTTFTYLMKVEYRGERYIQTIFEAYIEDENYFNFIVRKSPYFFEDWEVSSFQLVDRKYVANTIANALENKADQGEVDSLSQYVENLLDSIITINLGIVEKNPYNPDNEMLNAITTDGLYSFSKKGNLTFEGETYIMTVIHPYPLEKPNYILQNVMSINSGLVYKRIFDETSWSITSFEFTKKSEVVVNLGELGLGPDVANNTQLNSITEAGTYAFTYDNDGYILIHSNRANGNWGQCVLKCVRSGVTNKVSLEILYRYKKVDETTGEVIYGVSEEDVEIATTDYVRDYVNNKHLYEHNLYINGTGLMCHMTLMTNSADTITLETLDNYLTQDVFGHLATGSFVFSGTYGQSDCKLAHITSLAVSSTEYTLSGYLEGHTAMVSKKYESFSSINDSIRQIY